MKRLEEFRIYYNQTIHPELVRLERLRLRLLRLIFLSTLILGGLVIFQLYVGMLILSLALMVPITIYIIYLGSRVRKFIRTFKPQVMNLILDFIDDGLNRGTMTYAPKKRIERDRFFKSQLFVTKAKYYEGEDYIAGMVGEMKFELCELDVREISRIETRLDTIFKGIFLCAEFPENVRGELIIWPRNTLQYNTRSIRNFTWEGAVNVEDEVMVDHFREQFFVFAKEETHVAGILTEPMQEAIYEYAQYTGKDIYASFLNRNIYIAVSEPKDILEPHLFQSNLSFELVREFFEDVNLLLEIIEEFDKTH